MNSGRGDVERPPHRLAPTHRDDLGPGRERVQPLRCRGHAGAHHRDPRGVLVRLVGVHDARVRGELVRDRKTRVAGGDEDVPEDAAAADVEAAVDRADPVDPPRHEALVPAAALPQLLDVAEEGGDGGPVAVADAEHERPQVAAPHRFARGQTGKRRRVAVAVALGAHQPLPDRGRARAPGGRRVRRVAEDRDLARREPGVAQCRERDEAPEPGADDRDSFGHRGLLH